MSNSSPLALCKVIRLTMSPLTVGGVVHDQADMFEKPGQVLELGHRDDQFLEVFEPPRRVGRLVGLHIPV